jgi:hypothetical protein
MVVDYTLNPNDIASARLLAIGIRPGVKLGLFAGAVARQHEAADLDSEQRY